MIDELFLRNLGIIIIAAAALTVAARAVNIPTIVAYLFAGLALGPLSGLIEITGALELISEVGIALLLFLVGLELSFSKIRDVGKVAILAGLGQIIFTAAGGFGVCWLLGFEVIDAVFLTTGLTFSSTVVVVKLLEEKEELDSLYGRISIGIFLVQDLVVIVVLTIVTGISSGKELSVTEIFWNLSLAIGGMAVLLGVAIGASYFLLLKPFAWAARSPPTLFIWSLCWCFILVEAAHLMHLSLEIGAFLAGVSLAQLPYNQDLRRRVHPLMNFFIAIFFVSLGIKMDVQAGLVHWDTTLALSLFVLVGTPFIFMWIISWMGYTEETSFLVSVTVAQISEFSFVFVAMGVSVGLIGGDIMAITGLVGLVTFTGSAYMILYNHELYRLFHRWRLLRMFRARSPKASIPASRRRSGHVIVVGMNTLGREIARRLWTKGEKVVAIDLDPAKLTGLPCETLLGNVEFLSVLEEADLPYAKLLVSALQIEETSDLLAYRCRYFNVPCGIHAVDLDAIDTLLDMDVTYLIIPKVDGIKLQREELKREGYLSQ